MSKVLKLIAPTALAIILTATSLFAQRPMGRNFGFGLILGDPVGATIKVWTAPDQAFTGMIAASYFGSPRIGGDYIWHFNAFNSDVVNMYAGPGLVLGIGRGAYYIYRNNGDVFYVRDDGVAGIAARVMLGINIVPRQTPIEIFLEAGPLIGISPGFGAAIDLGLGIRFYP